MSGFVIKQGNTFALCLTFTDASGAPVSLSGCVIQSQVRDVLGNIIATLRCTQPAGVLGAVNLWGGATTSWPPGQLVCDVSVIWAQTGVIQSTQTFNVTVQRAVTALPITPAPLQLPSYAYASLPAAPDGAQCVFITDRRIGSGMLGIAAVWNPVAQAWTGLSGEIIT